MNKWERRELIPTEKHYTLEDLVRLTAGDKRFDGLRKKCPECEGKGWVYFYDKANPEACQRWHETGDNQYLGKRTCYEPAHAGEEYEFCGGKGYVPVDGDKALAWMLEFLQAQQIPFWLVGGGPSGYGAHVKNPSNLGLSKTAPWDALADALYQWRERESPGILSQNT